MRKSYPPAGSFCFTNAGHHIPHVFYALNARGSFNEYNSWNGHIYGRDYGGKYDYWVHSRKTCRLELALTHPDLPMDALVSGERVIGRKRG